MKCFYHHDVDAVGICRSCQKGVCHQCGNDLGRGLACRDRCEGDVRGLLALVEQNVRLAPTSGSLIMAQRRNMILACGYFLFMGLIFIVWGVSTPWKPFNFALFLGAGLTLFGLAQLVRTIRHIRPAQPSEK